MPTGIELFYLACAASGLLFTVFSAIVGHRGHVSGKVGHGHGAFKLGTKGHSHSGHGTGTQDSQFISLSIISPLTGAIFLGLLGFLGLIGRAGFNMSPTVSLLFAVPLSLIISALFSWAILKLLFTSQSSSIAKVQEATGLRAKVVTKIEKGRLGSIAYIDKGTRLTLPARAEDDESFERGDDVYISRTDGKTAYVRRERNSLWQ
ncbi:MAG: hypothetical protein AB1489_36785 [Acidobacteriota bacterium]